MALSDNRKPMNLVIRKGPPGFRGWSMVLGSVVDGARVVHQVVDWVNGSGPKPATGDYLGPDGLVSDIADATDIAPWKNATSIDISGSGPLDISNLASTHQSIRLYGTLSGDRPLTVGSAAVSPWIFTRDTSGDYEVSVGLSGQAPKPALPPDESRLLAVIDGAVRNVLSDLAYFDGAAYIDVTDAGSPLVVKESTLRSRMLVVTGTLTEDLDVVLEPNGTPGPWHYVNLSSGGYAVRLHLNSLSNPALTTYATSLGDPRALLLIVNTFTNTIQSIIGDWGLKGEITKIDMDGVTNLTLTPQQELANILGFENLTADATVTTSGAHRGPWWVLNTSGSYKVNFVGSAGDPVEVPPGTQVPYAHLLYRSASTGLVLPLQSPAAVGDVSGLEEVRRVNVLSGFHPKITPIYDYPARELDAALNAYGEELTSGHTWEHVDGEVLTNTSTQTLEYDPAGYLVADRGVTTPDNQSPEGSAISRINGFTLQPSAASGTVVIPHAGITFATIENHTHLRMLVLAYQDNANYLAASVHVERLRLWAVVSGTATQLASVGSSSTHTHLRMTTLEARIVPCNTNLGSTGWALTVRAGLGAQSTEAFSATAGLGASEQLFIDNPGSIGFAAYDLTHVYGFYAGSDSGGL